MGDAFRPPSLAPFVVVTEAATDLVWQNFGRAMVDSVESAITAVHQRKLCWLLWPAWSHKMSRTILEMSRIDPQLSGD
jgi:hypothetical protein